jgi:RNA-directed DNA polymerase
MSLTPPPTVQKLREALHAKAKRAPKYRFYALYDKVYRKDVLWHAYQICRTNDGTAGVDGITFEDIERQGVTTWLGVLEEELKRKTYRPSPVRRVHIPKPDGKTRPLGIPTIRDRVVQTAALIVLEPIFEADMPPEQYAYRANKSALEAVDEVHRLVYQGYTEVVDADLSGYFDSIPHAELLKSLARRVSDRHLLHLVKMWLVAPVEESDERGRRHRTTRTKDTGRGTPQGAPISPLLSNLYMRRFALGWKLLGYGRALQARIVNYADDFVICCRGTAEQAMTAMREMMSKLKLTVNETKTRLCRVPAESFEFLGYRIGQCYSLRTGRPYIGTRPAPKKIKQLCRKISEQTERRWQALLDTDEVIGRLNCMMEGWANYFRLGSVSRAYKAVDSHACRRLRQWLCALHKVRDQGESRFPDRYLHQKLNLIRLQDRTKKFPWNRRHRLSCAKA